MKLVVGVLIVAVLGTSCGVPADDQAERVDDVPFGLLDPQPSTPAESVGPTEGPVVQIYLVDSTGQKLAPVERRLSQASAFDVVEALMAGPTARERQQGMSTALGSEAVVSRVELVGGVASVDLTGRFAALDGLTQQMGIAQLVLTLTGRPGIGRISFTLDGQPIDIPRGDGTLATGSVSRDNYREFLTEA